MPKVSRECLLNKDPREAAEALRSALSSMGASISHHTPELGYIYAKHKMDAITVKISPHNGQSAVKIQVDYTVRYTLGIISVLGMMMVIIIGFFFDLQGEPPEVVSLLLGLGTLGFLSNSFIVVSLRNRIERFIDKIVTNIV